MSRRARWRQTPIEGLGADPGRGGFLAERRRFVTELVHRGPAPVQAPPLAPTADLDVVRFRADGRTLRAWLRLPSHDGLARGGRAPALVYLHGAYVLEAAALAPLAPFVEAGVAVLAPTLRGEHGNAGDHELFLGELDDARAAVAAAAEHPRLDPGRVLVLGHSGGGLLSAMLALDPSLSALDTASVNGVYDERLFDRVDHLPFRDGPEERRLRVFAPHLEGLAQPHLACVGEHDLLASALPGLVARARAARVPFEGRLVAGDHYGAIGPAVAAFLARVRPRL